MTHDFIHIGDLHLDERSPRNADRLQALDQIVAECLDREALAAWLIPGDLFHARPFTSPTVRHPAPRRLAPDSDCSVYVTSRR